MKPLHTVRETDQREETLNDPLFTLACVRKSAQILLITIACLLKTGAVAGRETAQINSSQWLGKVFYIGSEPRLYKQGVRRKEVEKGNPVSGGITGPPCS
jgi:hypothetical protein